MSQNAFNFSITTIAVDGTIKIPKEILSDTQLRGEVELIKFEEGILIKPKAPKSWGDFFETKLKMNKPTYIDLSEVNEDEFIY
ncbi:hypothetical protein H8E77_41210 [bacterium]|nr:hypothetical protein [bacterium]